MLIAFYVLDKEFVCVTDLKMTIVILLTIVVKKKKKCNNFCQPSCIDNQVIMRGLAGSAGGVSVV